MMNGIDTSAWQKSKVDYNLYKKNGGDFVFLRIGCGQTKDKCFETDYANAVKAGLKVGAYFYSYDVSTVDALNSATRVLGWLDNRHLDFPIAYDLEDAKQKKLTKALNSSMFNTFKGKLEMNGIYDAILYTGEYFFNNYFEKNYIKDDVWIAKYSTVKPNVGKTISVWQYSSSEIDEPYYKGKLDRDYMLTDSFQGSEEQIITPSVFNPYAEPTRTLKLSVPRMKGSDVKWLQTELGCPDNEIDGVFGPLTRSRVIVWQKAHGLLVDGIVGSATRYSLKYD